MGTTIKLWAHSQNYQVIILTLSLYLPSFLRPQHSGCTFLEATQFSPGLHLSSWRELKELTSTWLWHKSLVERKRKERNQRRAMMGKIKAATFDKETENMKEYSKKMKRRAEKPNKDGEMSMHKQTRLHVTHCWNQWCKWSACHCNSYPSLPLHWTRPPSPAPGQQHSQHTM